MLAIQTTPLVDRKAAIQGYEHTLPSPGEILWKWELQTNLIRNPVGKDYIREDLKVRQEKQKYYHDCYSQDPH